MPVWTDGRGGAHKGQRSGEREMLRAEQERERGRGGRRGAFFFHVYEFFALTFVTSVTSVTPVSSTSVPQTSIGPSIPDREHK